MSFKLKLVNVGVKIKKHAPEIAITAGVAGTVVAGVLACKATTKFNEKVTEPTKKEIEIINKVYEENKDNAENPYTKKDRTSDLIKAYIKCAGRIIKLYGIPVFIEVLSALLIFKGFSIESARKMAIAAALETANAKYEDVKKAVIKNYGESVWNDIEDGIEVDHKIMSHTDPETGKITESEETIISAPENPTGYSFWFDPETVENCDKSNEYNLMMIESAFSQANREFQLTKKKIFLSRIMDLLQVRDEKRPVEALVMGRIYPSADSKKPGYLDYRVQMAYKRNSITGEINYEKRYPFITIRGMENIAGKVYLADKQEMVANEI